MRFALNASATFDVSLSNLPELLRALRDGDSDRLLDAVDVVDYDFDLDRAE